MHLAGLLVGHEDFEARGELNGFTVRLRCTTTERTISRIRRTHARALTRLRVLVDDKVHIASAANMKNVLVGDISDEPSFNGHDVQNGRFLQRNENDVLWREKCNAAKNDGESPPTFRFTMRSLSSRHLEK